MKPIVLSNMYFVYNCADVSNVPNISISGTRLLSVIIVAWSALLALSASTADCSFGEPAYCN